MITMTDNLPDDINNLKEKIRVQDQHIKILEERLRLLTAKLYGRKSEKMSEQTTEQPQLFDEIEVSAEQASKADEVKVPAHSRKRGGRRPLPEELPRVEQIHDISEDEKVCACGSQLSRIGEEVCEKLDIVPAKIQVIKHIRYKYACKSCEGVESAGGAVKTAELPPQIIPQGIATLTSISSNNCGCSVVCSDIFSLLRP
ncbi:MAG: IS66 family transposase zinc-finger binding domain-containing protein, partial [Nitrospirae bacterium YQR-1]